MSKPIPMAPIIRTPRIPSPSTQSPPKLPPVSSIEAEQEVVFANAEHEMVSASSSQETVQDNATQEAESANPMQETIHTNPMQEADSIALQEADSSTVFHEGTAQGDYEEAAQEDHEGTTQEDHEGTAQEEEAQPTGPERRSDSLASAFSDQDHFDATPSLSPEGDGTAPPQTPPGGLPAEMTFAVKYRHGRIWRSWVPCFVVVNQQSVTKYPNEKRKEQKKKVIVLYDATISVGAGVGSDD